MKRSFSWVQRNVSPIAIDFGSRTVRMLQVAQYRGQPTVVASAERALPPGLTNPSDIDAAADEAVTEMLREGGFSGRDAATCIGWGQMQIRNLRIPQMPEADIGEVIKYEAAERFGMQPDDSEIRFLLAGDVRQGTDVKQEIIAFGASGSTINTHIARLTKLGLRPVGLDAAPCAVFRPFERFLRRDVDANQVNVFVDMGYAATRVLVSRGPDMIFFKSIPIGGKKYDEMVSQKLELSLEDAAQIRSRLHRQHVAALTGQEEHIDEDEVVGENMEQAVIDALRPSLDQLSKEIGLCLRYCSVTFRGIRADTVTAVGGDACNQRLLRVLSDSVNVDFEIGKATRNIAAEGDFGGSDRRTGQPEWATAMGLAIKPVTIGLEAAS